MILNWRGAADNAAPDDVTNGAAKPDAGTSGSQELVSQNASFVQYYQQLELAEVIESRWPAPGKVAVWHELKAEEVREFKGFTPGSYSFHCRHCFAELIMLLKEGQQPTRLVFSCIEHKADGIDDKGRAVSWSKPTEARFIVPCHVIG